jgi:orotidine-5'-phosphate decarboxylase
LSYWECDLGQIIKNYERSIIVSCDVKNINDLLNLVTQTCDVDGIGGYKIGSILTMRYGIDKLVETIREFTDKPIIYDHQKAMTDIPDLADDFVSTVKELGVDALIGFPQSGPLTEEAWIKACTYHNLEVIIGGEMTHPKYKRSEGGYLADEALDEIYLLAARLGVNNFVVPGTLPARVKHYREIMEPIVKDLTFYSPGFIAQGGVITEIAEVAGRKWHAIVGRAIYTAKNIKAAAEEMTKNLLK